MGEAGNFDNFEVGRMQARAVLAVKPKGNYVFIKGSPTDPNANFLRAVGYTRASLQLVAGTGFTCGLDVAGTAYCWGANNLGQTGGGTVSPFVATPSPVAGHTFVSLAAGGSTACGIATNRTGDCNCIRRCAISFASGCGSARAPSPGNGAMT